jgi:uncharacterized PurR-regulated membrane protein YhhQ (DUF165 family)
MTMTGTAARRGAAAALAAIYITSIIAANALTSRYGLVRVAPHLYAPAGTIMIGGVIMTRDLLQDAVGRWWIFAAIGAGAAGSWLTSSHQIALASGITFAVAETAEWAIYTPWRARAGWGTRKWGGAVSVANVTGALADTLLFLTLAGFPVTAATVTGQMVGKFYVTAAVVAAGLAIRAVTRRRETVPARA